MKTTRLSHTKWKIETIVNGKIKEVVYNFPLVLNQVGWDFECIKKAKDDYGDWITRNTEYGYKYQIN